MRIVTFFIVRNERHMPVCRVSSRIATEVSEHVYLVSTQLCVRYSAGMNENQSRVE